MSRAKGCAVTTVQCMDMAVCASFSLGLWAAPAVYAPCPVSGGFPGLRQTGFAFFQPVLYVARSRRVKPLSMQTRLKASPWGSSSRMPRTSSTYWCAISRQSTSCTHSQSCVLIRLMLMESRRWQPPFHLPIASPEYDSSWLGGRIALLK